jgi:hypothetical protein
VHNTTDINKKRGETARAMSGTAQQAAHTAMDHALKAHEINTELLRLTSRAWAEGFRYQAQLSQGMARVFFGQWGNAFARMPRVELPAQEHSRGSEVTEGATNGGARKATEAAAEDDAQKKKGEIAAKEDAQKKKAEKEAKDAEEAREAEEARKAEKVAEDTRKAEKVAQETREATETAAKSAQESTEPGAQETQKSTEVAARDAQESAGTASFPIEGYDEMNRGEVSERLDGLSAEELKRVRRYEKHNKDRGSLRKEMKQKIETQRGEADE